MDVKILIALLTLVMCTYEGYSIRIGAFNIKELGTAKIEKVKVIDLLLDIIGRYDILFIQELMDESRYAIQELDEKVKLKYGTDTFKALLTSPYGRTTRKEQYVVLYKEGSGVTALEYRDFKSIAVNDEAATYDIFEREPFIVLFQSNQTTIGKFALIVIHVAESDTVKELQALEVVIGQTKAFFNVDDVMVLGTLYADCSYVSNEDWANVPMKNDPDYTWWIADDVDTTVSNKTNCAYDRFISTGKILKASVEEGSATVFKFDEVFNLNQTMALSVSDHYPIEFVLKKGPRISGSSMPYINIYSLYGLVLCTILSIMMG